MTDIVFVVPGRIDQLTGGYLFDRHIVEGLRRRGRDVRVIELDPREGATALAALPDGAAVVIDGLALPLLAPVMQELAGRARLVGLVHHPLASETGLPSGEAARLAALEAALLPRFRGILCPSRRTAAALERYGVARDRIAIVPPGTDRPRWARLPCRARVSVLLCIASLTPRKGHLVLIEALARLKDLDWSLTCVGSRERDPPAVRAIRRNIAAAGLARRISLLGERPPSALAGYYRRADAFVLPSFDEGFGMVFAEAMAYGLPIVATAAGAIPEVVPANAGLLVPPGDARALARALRRVLTEPGLAPRLRRGARAAARRLPDWVRTIAAWEAALDRLARLVPPKRRGDRSRADVVQRKRRGALAANEGVDHVLATGITGGSHNILIVDGDRAVRQALAEQLALNGEFASLACGTAARALQLIRREPLDAILVDDALPDMDGRELCRRLRTVGVGVPILLLTAAEGGSDCGGGADDTLPKPLRLSVLLACLRGHLQQSGRGEGAVFPIGPYTFRPSVKLLVETNGHRQVRLTEKETAILDYLYRARDRAIARDTLLGEVWGYNTGVTTHTLETHVYRLRRKIERDPARAEILVTEPGGYRLVP